MRMNFPLDARELSASEMVILHSSGGSRVRVIGIDVTHLELPTSC